MKFNKTVLLLSGAIFLGMALHAQSTDSNPAGADSSRRSWTRHSHGPRMGNDSLHRREGWRPGAAGGTRPGLEGHGWARSRKGEHRPMIHFTPEQRQQMMAIDKDFRKRSEDLYKKDNITLREYKAGLIALQKEKKNKLQALLTPAQKEELAKWKAKRAENAQVMAAARLERLKIRLSLSDEQVAKVKAGQASLKAQAESIHGNEDLLPQQKREQLRDLMAKREDALKSVLTPEQLSKFQEMRKGHMRHMQGWSGHRS